MFNNNFIVSAITYIITDRRPGPGIQRSLGSRRAAGQRRDQPQPGKFCFSQAQNLVPPTPGQCLRVVVVQTDRQTDGRTAYTPPHYLSEDHANMRGRRSSFRRATGNRRLAGRLVLFAGLRGAEHGVAGDLERFLLFADSAPLLPSAVLFDFVC